MKSAVVAAFVALVFAVIAGVRAVSLPTPPDNYYLWLTGKPLGTTITLRKVWHSPWQSHDYMCTPTSLTSKTIYDEWTDIRRDDQHSYRIGTSNPTESCYARTIVFPLAIFGTPDIEWSVAAQETACGVTCDVFKASGIPTGVGSFTADYTAYFYENSNRPCKLYVSSLTSFTMNVAGWNTDVQSDADLSAPSGCDGVMPEPADCPAKTAEGETACLDALCQWCDGVATCVALDDTCPEPEFYSSSSSSPAGEQPEDSGFSSETETSTSGGGDDEPTTSSSSSGEPAETESSAVPSDAIALPSLPCSVHFKATTSVYTGTATYTDELWIGHSSIWRKDSSLVAAAGAPRSMSNYSDAILVRADLGLAFNSSASGCSSQSASVFSNAAQVQLSLGPVDLTRFNWTEVNNDATWSSTPADSYTGNDPADSNSVMTVFYARGTARMLGASGTVTLAGGVFADVTVTVSAWAQQTLLDSVSFAVPTTCSGGPYGTYPTVPQSFIDTCLATAPTESADSSDGGDDGIDAASSIQFSAIACILMALLVA